MVNAILIVLDTLSQDHVGAYGNTQLTKENNCD